MSIDLKHQNLAARMAGRISISSTIPESYNRRSLPLRVANNSSPAGVGLLNHFVAIVGGLHRNGLHVLANDVEVSTLPIAEFSSNGEHVAGIADYASVS